MDRLTIAMDTLNDAEFERLVLDLICDPEAPEIATKSMALAAPAIDDYHAPTHTPEIRLFQWTCPCGVVNDLSFATYCTSCGTPNETCHFAAPAAVATPQLQSSTPRACLPLSSLGQFALGAKLACVRHGKLRSICSLVTDGRHFFCRDDSQCKIGENDPAPVLKQQLMCSVHQRIRASWCLERTVNGLLCCKARKQCKVGGKDGL